MIPVDLHSFDVIAGRDEHSPTRRGHQLDEGAVVGQFHVQHLNLKHNYCMIKGRMGECGLYTLLPGTVG